MPGDTYRALPQFARGFALFHKAPFLSGDRIRIHALGEMVDGAPGDRIAYAGIEIKFFATGGEAGRNGVFKSGEDSP